MMKEDSIQQVKQRFGIIGNDPTLNRAIDVAMQVAGVGFIISVIQDSSETALNSSTDVLFTAAVDQAHKA